MDLFCDRCDAKLTRNPLSHADLNSAGGGHKEELLSDGEYLLADEIDLMSFTDKQPVLITHYVSTTCLRLIDHHDAFRFQGCCGPGQTHKYNQVCWKCKYQIGVIIADCLGPHFTAINMERLNMRPKWS